MGSHYLQNVVSEQRRDQKNSKIRKEQREQQLLNKFTERAAITKQVNKKSNNNNCEVVVDCESAS